MTNKEKARALLSELQRIAATTEQQLENSALQQELLAAALDEAFGEGFVAGRADEETDSLFDDVSECDWAEFIEIARELKAKRAQRSPSAVSEGVDKENKP